MQHQQFAEERGLLGPLCPGQKKLEGKTFYLDSVKKRATTLLLEAISLLGGRVESFLHKDVSFVVTGSQEGLKEMDSTDTKAGAKGTKGEAQSPIMTRESVLSKEKQRPGTPRPVACGSRGRALLEKAMRNNERLQRNNVLTNAQSWGVKILYVDDVLLFLKQLTRESFSATHKKPEKSKQQGSNAVKAAALRSPYLKIEDLSKKYKPLHMQSITFPTLWYQGRFSPFESPPPPRFEKQKDQGEQKAREKKNFEVSLQDKSETPLSCNPSPWRPRKKDLSYCECCHQPFSNLEEHLQSDQHRAFVLDISNYSMVDQLVAEMLPGFDPNPFQQLETILSRPPTPSYIQDVCELEPLTDIETEHAVQALQRQGSVFNHHISSPTKGPQSPSPASPSLGLPFPFPSPDTPPADLLPFTTDCQLSHSHPRASSPVMPVLEVEQQGDDSASHQPHKQDLPLCPDPYSLPPVLSPYPPDTMEPHSPFSQPPALSPQWYTVEETEEGHNGEIPPVLAATIPISSPLFHPVALTNAEKVKGTNQGRLSGFNGIVCSTDRWDCTSVHSGRSHSLPRDSVTAPNHKKRCRSASPEHSQSKRRKFCNSGSWTEQGYKSAQPENDTDSCETLQPCSLQKVSTTCTETLGSQQTFTMFCVPTVQTFTQTPNQMSILCRGGTFVGDHPSWPPSSKANCYDPPLHFSKDKSISSQDSQRSPSHSTSVCIESALIPDLARLSPSSSDSDWDCELLASIAPPPPTEQSHELDKELLQRPCAWMHDTSYESRLHTVLQPSTPATSLCGEDMEPSAFSRTVVPIVEVQH